MNWRLLVLLLGVTVTVTGACSSEGRKINAMGSGAGEGGSAKAGAAGIGGTPDAADAGAGGTPAEPPEGGAAGEGGDGKGPAEPEGGAAGQGEGGSGGEGGTAERYPSITTPSDMTTTLATAFTLVVQATGSGPLTFSLKSGALPAGILLDSSTGELSGTTKPAALVSGSVPGRYDLVIRAANSVGFADTAPFSITVGGVTLPKPLVYFTYDTADVTATQLNDASGNGHSATISGGVTTAVSGAVGQAFKLDGTTGLVQAAGVPTPSGPISLVATVKPSALGVGARIPVQYGISDPAPTYRGNWIQTDSEGHIGGVFEDGVDNGVLSTTTLSVDAFTPVGTTWDDASQVGRLYVGGLQEGTPVSTAGPLLYATTNFETGRHPQFAARFWQGSLDEVAMWNVLLSPEQMATVAWLSKTGQSMKAW